MYKQVSSILVFIREMYKLQNVQTLYPLFCSTVLFSMVDFALLTYFQNFNSFNKPNPMQLTHGSHPRSPYI